MMAEFDAGQLVFVDESGCDSRTGQRKTGWAPTGLTPELVTRLERSARYSVLPAYTVDGVLTADVYTGHTDGEVFINWIRDKLLPLCNPWPEPRSVVVMDNVSFHHSEGIEELFTDAGVRLVYLPPYSPDFNPIEEYFAQLKAAIRRDFWMWEEGRFESFESFLIWCIEVTGSDDKAARGHFQNCYIAV